MSLVIISGPSCSGKTTVANVLTSKHNFIELKSHTTRKRRTPQEDDYYYVSKDEFDSLEFVERVEYAGNSYGLSKNELSRVFSCPGQYVVIVEAHGAEQIWEQFKDTIPILRVFLDTPDEQLERRLIERGIDVALRRARWPKDRARKNWYNKVLINLDYQLDKTCSELLQLHKDWLVGKYNQVAACDGGCQNTVGCWAITMMDEVNSNRLVEGGVIQQSTTNNVAEYTALIKLLKRINAYPTNWAAKVTIYTDSNLMFSQIKGDFKVKKEHLKPLWSEAKKLLLDSPFKVILEWVPREHELIKLVDKETKRLLGG